MNARQTRAYIKKNKDKSGSYRELAEKLEQRSGREISGSGVYQWYVRGIIPEFWIEFMESIGD